MPNVRHNGVAHVKAIVEATGRLEARGSNDLTLLALDIVARQVNESYVPLWYKVRKQFHLQDSNGTIQFKLTIAANRDHG